MTENSRHVETLRKAWINENCAPELLPLTEEIEDSMCALIEKLSEWDSEQELSRSNNQVIVDQLKIMEVERIKYMLKKYTSERLKKIDKFCSSLVKKQDEIRMSEYELEYLESIYSLYVEHISGVLSRNDDFVLDEKMVIKANDYKAVFVRVCEDIDGEISFGVDKTFEAKKGDIYIIPYLYISNYISSGEMELL
jgi:GINS complex subunit 4